MPYNIWTFLSIITIVLLVVFWNKRNAVWGGLTLGIVIGFIISSLFVFRGEGFDWHIVGKTAVVGTLLGFIAELLGRVSDYLRRKT